MRKDVGEFKKARQELISWIGIVPSGKREVVCAGVWSLKDIMSHFIGWAKYQNNILHDLSLGKEPCDFSNVQQYNADSVSKRKDWHWDKMYKEFLKATEQLLSNYMFLPGRLWDKPVWKNKKTTPAKLIKIETKHYRDEHLEQIKKLMKKH